jgi:hypothetical protein
MSNPQGPGKHARKDKAKAQQSHHAAASAPGRSDQQHGQSARSQSDQGHMPHRPSHSSSHSHSSQHSHSSEDEE